MPDLSRPSRHGASEPPSTPELDRLGGDLLARHADLVTRVRETDERTLGDQIEVTSIPAPPFGEADRARWMAERLAACGASEVTIDTVGNVVGRLPGADPTAAPIVVSAHLDTVFPAGTEVQPRREDDRILAPGISDDGRGLAALLTIVRVLSDSGTRTATPILVAATVGEEGVGDLRGVRALFEGPARDAAAFVSLDGAGVTRVVTAGVGSRRRCYRVRGPGGHSWVDWGRPNPIEIVGRALAALPRQDEMPAATTWSAGRVGGGTSINAIPESAWIELEVRAERATDLRRIDARVTDTFRKAVAEANRTARRPASGGGDDPLTASLVVETIGDRPAGSTPSDDLLVGAAVAATRALDLPVELAASSTDANVPMALGIPALTMGAGGEARGAHTLGEWYRNTLGPEGIVRALLTILIWDAATAERRGAIGEAAD